MCCILYCLTHPDFAINRDEYLKRPATASQWHSFPSTSSFTIENSPTASIAHAKISHYQSSSQPSSARQVLSCLDAHPSGGGTWLGLSWSGRIAAITNFTESAPPPLPDGRGLEKHRSRGSLVRDWLTREECGKSDAKEMETYLEGVASHMDEWPGFNLLVGQVSKDPQTQSLATRLGYVSNRTTDDKTVVYLDDKTSTGVEGVVCGENECVRAGGLSNSVLKEPWDKVKQGQLLLEEALRAYDGQRMKGITPSDAETHLSSALNEILEKKVDITKRSDFMNSIQIPPVRLVNDAWYATRTATVLLVRKDGLVRWWERDVYVLSAQGEPIRAEDLHLTPRYFEWDLKA